MIVLKAGAYLATDTLAMSMDEAFAVKNELKARGTKAALRLADEMSMPAKVVHRVDSDKRMDEIRALVQWMSDRIDSARMRSDASDDVIALCNRLLLPIHELVKMLATVEP